MQCGSRACSFCSLTTSIVRQQACHDTQDDPARVLVRDVPGLAQQAVQQLTDGRDLAGIAQGELTTGGSTDW
jgi:hypothetical protein